MYKLIVLELHTGTTNHAVLSPYHNFYGMVHQEQKAVHYIRVEQLTCMCMYTHTHVHVHAHVHTHTHTHTHTHRAWKHHTVPSTHTQEHQIVPSGAKKPLTPGKIFEMILL